MSGSFRDNCTLRVSSRGGRYPKWWEKGSKVSTVSYMTFFFLGIAFYQMDWMELLGTFQKKAVMLVDAVEEVTDDKGGREDRREAGCN
jgi:hypothetical protein